MAPLSRRLSYRAIRNAPRSSQSDSEDAYSEYAEDLGVEPALLRLLRLLLSTVVGRRELALQGGPHHIPSAGTEDVVLPDPR